MIVAAAIGLAGCSGAASRTAASASGCTGPGISAGQVSLGVIFPNSGTNSSSFDAYRAGVDARLGVANASGGVGGRKVSYRWADDGSLNASNLAAAQELIRQDVFGIVEIGSSTAGSAAWLHEQQVPVVGTAVDPVWSKYRNMFSSDYFVALGPSISTWGDYVSAHGGHRAALLYSPIDSGSQILFRQYANSLKAAGIVVDPISVDLKATSATPVAAQIARNHDDVLTSSVDPGTFAQVAQATNQAAPGQLKVILSTIGYDSTFLAVFGKSLPGLTTVVTYTPFEEHTVPLQKFLAAMTLYSPEVQPAENEIAIAGWLDTDLALTGLAAAGPCPTRASFMTGLRDVTHYDAGGLLPTPVNLKTNFGQMNLCYTFVRIAPTGTSWQVDKPAPRCGHPLQ